MIRRAIRECPVCGGLSVEVLHSQKFVLNDGHPLRDGYDVVACLECGAAYADTPASQQAFDTLYQNDSKYQSAATSTGGGDRPWDAERLAETAQTISGVLGNRSLSIADVGCANGGLLEALHRLGHTTLTGIDPAPACVAHTRSRGIDAHPGSLTAIPGKVATFDVVILSHVLEHVRDLAPAMAGLRRLLHAGSRVYLEVPDAARYADFVSAPFQDFNTEHINHFSGISLDNLARNTDLIPLGAFTQKVVKSSADTLYPAVFNFYSCGEPTSEMTRPLRKDVSLRDRVIDYIAISSEIMRSMNRRLARELAGCPEVALWGTGQLALKLLGEDPLRTASIRACVDSNPVMQGKRLRNVPVLPPDGLSGTDCPIVITSTLHENEIRSAIRGMGMSNRLISLRPDDAGSPRKGMMQ